MLGSVPPLRRWKETMEGGHSEPPHRLQLHAVSTLAVSMRWGGRKRKEEGGDKESTVSARHNFSFSDLPTGGINPIESQRVVSQKINGRRLMLPHPPRLTTSTTSLLSFNYFLSKKKKVSSDAINELGRGERTCFSFLSFLFSRPLCARETGWIVALQFLFTILIVISLLSCERDLD